MKEELSSNDTTLKSKVDNSVMPTCNILGVNIAVTNMRKTIDYINSNINDIKGEYICVSNVHTTVMSYDDEIYRNIQNSAIFALPDGKPLSVISRKRGYSQAERVAGPDLMGEIFLQSNDKEYTHYFYGSTQETLDTLRIKLNEKYPCLKIVGMYSPPFRLLTDEEDEGIIKLINDIKPDFVWVGLGAPKQEIWMYNHKNKVNSLMIGVGAGFDYYAENIKRAPMWMQKCSLEWLYRLLQDPKRLFGRYVVTNSKFIWNTVIRAK